MFLDQFITTFSDKNHSVKFQDLKLSTKNIAADYFAKYSKAQLSRCTWHIQWATFYAALDMLEFVSQPIALACV